MDQNLERQQRVLATIMRRVKALAPPRRARRPPVWVFLVGTLYLGSVGTLFFAWPSPIAWVTGGLTWWWSTVFTLLLIHLWAAVAVGILSMGIAWGGFVLVSQERHGESHV